MQEPNTNERKRSSSFTVLGKKSLSLLVKENWGRGSHFAYNDWCNHLENIGRVGGSQFAYNDWCNCPVEMHGCIPERPPPHDIQFLVACIINFLDEGWLPCIHLQNLKEKEPQLAFSEYHH